MEFRQPSRAIDEKQYKLVGLSLKNYERVKNVHPQNLLYLLYFKFGPSKHLPKRSDGAFTYLLETDKDGVYGAFYDYKGRISCGAYYPSTLEGNDEAISSARESAARVLTDFIDKVVVKPVLIGEYKFFTTSGRFEYSGRDFFNDLGLADLP